MSSPEVRTLLKVGGDESLSVTDTGRPRIVSSVSTLQQDERSVEPGKILVEIPYRPDENINPLLVEQIVHWSNVGVAVSFIRDPFAGWIDVLRNWMLYRFLQSPQFDFLLMNDSDVAMLHPMGLFHMASLNLPVVSAVACSLSQQRGLFACVAVKDDMGIARFPSIEKNDSIPAHGVVEIENAGTGCLLIRRDVAESIWSTSYLTHQTEVNTMLDQIGDAIKSGATPSGEVLGAWRESLLRMLHHMDDTGLPFDVPQSVRAEAARTGSLPRSEDVCFTDRVRRRGFKLYADLDVHCMHEKKIPLRWPDDKISKDLTVEEWTRTAMGVPVRF